MNEITCMFAERIKTLVIIGAGDFEGEVYWVTERMNGQAGSLGFLWGFVDDNESLWRREPDGYPALDPVSRLREMGCPV